MGLNRTLVLTIVLLLGSYATKCQSLRLSGSFGQLREMGKVLDNDLIQEERDPTFSFALSGQFLLPKNRFIVLGWQNQGYGVPFKNSLGVPTSLFGRVNRLNLFELGYGLDTKKFNKRDNFRFQSSIQALLNNLHDNKISSFETISLSVIRLNRIVPILSNEITFVHQASRRIQTKVSARINLSLSQISNNVFEINQSFRTDSFNSKTTGSSLQLHYGILYEFGSKKTELKKSNNVGIIL